MISSMDEAIPSQVSLPLIDTMDEARTTKVSLPFDRYQCLGQVHLRYLTLMKTMIIESSLRVACLLIDTSA